MTITELCAIATPNQRTRLAAIVDAYQTVKLEILQLDNELTLDNSPQSAIGRHRFTALHEGGWDGRSEKGNK